MVKAIRERHKSRALQSLSEGSCLYGSPRKIEQLERVPVSLLTALAVPGEGGHRRR